MARRSGSDAIGIGATWINQLGEEARVGKSSAYFIVIGLTRAVAEFGPEFKLIEPESPGLAGAEMFEAARNVRLFETGRAIPEVGQALKQFPDVPARDWAANAVLELRSVGILDRYADGTFSGG